MYLCQFIPLCFCASAACYLRPFSSFLWCSSACVFREQGYTPQPSSHLAKYAQVPSDGLFSLEVVLGVWLCPCSSSSLCSWSRGDENGGRSHVQTENEPTLICPCLGAEFCFPFTSQATSLCTTPTRGERSLCCLQVQQHLRKGSPVYYVGKTALESCL